VISYPFVLPRTNGDLLSETDATFHAQQRFQNKNKHFMLNRNFGTTRITRLNTSKIVWVLVLPLFALILISQHDKIGLDGDLANFLFQPFLNIRINLVTFRPLKGLENTLVFIVVHQW
jgi:hypothetical protein